MASGAWLVCPACGLRHTARTDGRCPKCSAPSAAPNLDAPGAVWRPPPPAPTLKTGRVPGGRRLALGCLILVSGLGAIVLMRGGAGPIVTKVLQWGDEIESEPVQRVAGSAWRFQVPPKRWYVSKRSFPDFEGGDGVTLERALVRPEGSAVAFLFSTRTGDRGLDLDALTDEFSKTFLAKVQGHKIQLLGPLPGRGGTRVLRMSANIDNKALEALCGLYPDAPMIYALVVGAPPRDFPALRKEMEGLLVSFQSDTPAR
jgi:hypothetical protein